MFKKSKIATIGALVAGLLGSSLALAPAAEAATGVSSVWQLDGTSYTRVAGARATVTTTITNRAVVTLTDKSRAYKSYKIVVRGMSNGKTYYSHTYSPWRAQYTLHALSVGPNLRTTPDPDIGILLPTYTVASLKSMAAHTTSASIHTLRLEDKTYYKEYGKEDHVLYGVAGNLYDDVKAWANRKSTYPTSWDSFGKPLTGTVDGYAYKITGTPRDFSVYGYVKSGVWLKLVNKKVSGEYIPVPAGSANSLEASGYYKWLKANA